MPCAGERGAGAYCILAQPVQADVLRRWPTRCCPAALAIRGLMRGHPLREHVARVRKDALLNVPKHSGRRAALRQDGDASQRDILDRAVGVLDLEDLPRPPQEEKDVVTRIPLLVCRIWVLATAVLAGGREVWVNSTIPKQDCRARVPRELGCDV